MLWVYKSFLSTNLQINKRLLHVVAAILSQCLGNNEESIGKGLNAKFGAALGGFALEDAVGQVMCACELEGACTWHQSLILDRVLGRP